MAKVILNFSIAVLKDGATLSSMATYTVADVEYNDLAKVEFLVYDSVVSNTLEQEIIRVNNMIKQKEGIPV